jgi:hypothetical protein
MLPSVGYFTDAVVGVAVSQLAQMGGLVRGSLVSMQGLREMQKAVLALSRCIEHEYRRSYLLSQGRVSTTGTMHPACSHLADIEEESYEEGL